MAITRAFLCVVFCKERTWRLHNHVPSSQPRWDTRCEPLLNTGLTILTTPLWLQKVVPPGTPAMPPVEVREYIARWRGITITPAESDGCHPPRRLELIPRFNYLIHWISHIRSLFQITLAHLATSRHHGSCPFSLYSGLTILIVEK